MRCRRCGKALCIANWDIYPQKAPPASRLPHRVAVAAVIIQWTGLLDWTTGLDYWTGLLDWITGLDYWTGLLDSRKLPLEETEEKANYAQPQDL